MDYNEFIQDKTDIIKLWLQQTLLNSRKSVASIAEAMGFKSESSLYKSTNPSENHRLHLENLPVLIHETGDFAILDEIEALLGRVSFVIPTAQAVPEIHAETGKAIKEFGELIQEVAQAVLDGRIDRIEKERLEKEGHEAIRQIAHLLETVRHFHDSNPRRLEAVGE